MACQWTVGCLVYMMVEVANILFLFAIYFQSRLIIEHEGYLTTWYFFLATSCGAMLVALWGNVITKVQLSNMLHLGLLCIFCGAFLITGVITVVYAAKLRPLTHPQLVKEIRTQYSAGHDAMEDIQIVYTCCGINNYTDWRDVIFANWDDPLETNQNLLANGELETVVGVYKTELPDIVSSCCRSVASCGSHLFIYFGLEDILTSAHRTHLRIQQNRAISGGFEPKIKDVIFTDPCYPHIYRNSRIAYNSILGFAISELVMLILTPLTTAFYYFRTKKQFEREQEELEELEAQAAAEDAAKAAENGLKSFVVSDHSGKTLLQETRNLSRNKYRYHSISAIFRPFSNVNIPTRAKTPSATSRVTAYSNAKNKPNNGSSTPPRPSLYK